MDKHKDNGILLGQADLVKYSSEVILMGGETQKELLNSVYKDIAEAFGIDVAIQFYQMYKGIQVTFPTRLFNPEYVKKQIPFESETICSILVYLLSF